jgi:AraC family transcriptional regulator
MSGDRRARTGNEFPLTLDPSPTFPADPGPARFSDGPGRLLGGLRRTHPLAEAGPGIAAQWAEFRTWGPLPGRVGDAVYGAICGVADGRIEFLCGVEVADLAHLPEGIGRMRVPPAHYAVFEHRGPAAATGATWQAIMNDWLPRSGRTPAPSPDFEIHRPGSTVVEIWVPVLPLGTAG